jgi:hypothetical protein
MVLRARSCPGKADGLDGFADVGGTPRMDPPAHAPVAMVGTATGLDEAPAWLAGHGLLQEQACLGKAGYGPGSAPFAMLRNHLIEAALSW